MDIDYLLLVISSISGVKVAINPKVGRYKEGKQQHGPLIPNYEEITPTLLSHGNVQALILLSNMPFPEQNHQSRVDLLRE